MTKASSLLKKSAAILIGLCLVAACSKSDQAKVSAANPGGGGGSGGNEKPGLAPTFSESQFKAKQKIVWKAGRSDGSKESECIEWRWAGFYAEGIEIEERVFKNCNMTAPSYAVEHILFNPGTGIVDENYSVLADGTRVAGKRKGADFFAHIYGNPKQQKETFTVQSSTYLNSKYPTFQRAKNGFFYLNQPETPFHAVATTWTKTSNGVLWTYTLISSDPVIAPIPKSLD